MSYRRNQLSGVFDESALNEKIDRIYQSIVAVLDRGITSSLHVERIKRLSVYKEWLEDERPIYSNIDQGPDKFANLIKLCRLFDKTSDFFINEAGVNATTVWRWATGNSRPSKYLAKALVLDLNKIVTAQIKEDLLILEESELSEMERVRT